jgi:plastocyanin
MTYLHIAAQGSTTVHVVTVGSKSGAIQFSPNNIKANTGDMVQFQFAAGNHTVTQSTFDQPCEPIAMNSNITGFFSGFMFIAPGSTDTAAYTIQINNTTPIWVYCSQAMHCQKGMTMVINEKYVYTFL